MSAIFFWCAVVFCAIILGALLPKILYVLLRLLLFVLAFILILWGFSKAGITPDSFSKNISSFFSKERISQKHAPKKQKSIAIFSVYVDTRGTLL